MKNTRLHLLFILFIVASFQLFAQQQSSDTSKVLIRFNESISREGIFDLRNFQIIKDDSTTVKIFKVGVSNDDRFVILLTEKHNPNSS